MDTNMSMNLCKYRVISIGFSCPKVWEPFLPTGIKKKLHTCFGTLEVNKTHVLCQHTSKFGISAKLQDMMCLLAHDHVFEESENLLREFLGLEISAKQIQRISEHYGQELEDLERSYQEDEGASSVEQPEVPVVSSTGEDPVYVMVDGSMIFTFDSRNKSGNFKLPDIVSGITNAAQWILKLFFPGNIHCFHFFGIPSAKFSLRSSVKMSTIG